MPPFPKAVSSYFFNHKPVSTDASWEFFTQFFEKWSDSTGQAVYLDSFNIG
jgi:hypothetical protein